MKQGLIQVASAVADGECDHPVRERALANGLLAEGYDVIGFDIEQHQYGDHRYPAQLVIQDVTTLHGSQFKSAALIVASPPCQKYSYMAMPWTLAKAKAAAIRADKSGTMLADLNCLFDACFRIQREACEAAGRHIPLIVENVKGAQPWVGRARWSFGSFYLWGDIPALMPIVLKAQKVPGFRFDGSGKSFQSASVAITDGRKNGNDWFGAGEDCSLQRKHGSKSSGRKMASAMIAKIPLPLSRWIGAAFLPVAATPTTTVIANQAPSAPCPIESNLPLTPEIPREASGTAREAPSTGCGTSFDVGTQSAPPTEPGAGGLPAPPASAPLVAPSRGADALNSDAAT